MYVKAVSVSKDAIDRGLYMLVHQDDEGISIVLICRLVYL